jgi:tricorn protease-like protein
MLRVYTKKILLLFIPLLLSFLYSCGILESESDPMPLHKEGYVNRIYSINIDGSDLKLLSYDDDYIASPTGDKIFIHSNDSIYSANPDGTNKHLLTPGSYIGLWFSSAANKICLEQKNTLDNYFINTDGSGLTKITLPNLLIYSWDISPSADKVVYSCNRGLYLTNIDGSNSILLKDTSNSLLVSGARFTSDGNSILFNQENYLNGASSFVLYNLKSGSSTNLFSGDVDYELSPPDTILFSSSGGIYLLNLKNNQLSELTGGGGVHFSPDRTRFSYFLSDNTSIHTYNLISNSMNHTDIYLPGTFLYNAYFTPDNSKIIFQADSTFYISKK